jgi:hypothetical protein
MYLIARIVIAIFVCAGVAFADHVFECDPSSVTYTAGAGYTPKKTLIVTGTPSCTFSQNDEDHLNVLFINAYSNATFLETAATEYNCHSYAWHQGADWINDDQLDAFIGDGSVVGAVGAVRGDIVAWPGRSHSGNMPPGTGGVVMSKWGSGPLMEHQVDDSPYDDIYSESSMEYFFFNTNAAADVINFRYQNGCVEWESAVVVGADEFLLEGRNHEDEDWVSLASTKDIRVGSNRICFGSNSDWDNLRLVERTQYGSKVYHGEINNTERADETDYRSIKSDRTIFAKATSVDNTPNRKYQQRTDDFLRFGVNSASTFPLN